MNLACTKCKAPMPPPPTMRGPLAGARFMTTAYRCAKCDHWNDLKKRKGFKEYERENSPPK